MKKARLLKTRGNKTGFQAEDQVEQYRNGVKQDVPISKETIRKKPVFFGSKGFTAWQRITKRNDNGMELETTKPIVFDGMGNVAENNELKGQCALCGKYVSQIFYCYVDGCKIALCRKHAYSFKQGDEKVYYCPTHYKHIVEEFDTWQEYKDKNRLRKNNEKQF